MERLAEMIARLGSHNGNPMVGFMSDKKYTSIKGIKLRCTDVTLLAQMNGDSVIEFDKYLPYGFLHVEAPELPPCNVALIHKIDFRNAWEIKEKGGFDERKASVGVEFKPWKKVSFFSPLGLFPMFEFLLVFSDESVHRYHGVDYQYL